MSRTSTALTILTLATGALLFARLPSDTQPAVGRQFTEKLLQNRYSLAVRNGQFSGTGAQLLQSAIAQSRFILVGENHAMAETTEFWKGICAAAGPQGFHTLAIEEGPLVAAELERWAGRDDGEAQLSAFQKQYPDSIDIYNTREEFGMLQQCVRAHQGAFHLWGLNQEAFGAGSLILSRILETRPAGEADSAMRQLLQKASDASAQALQTGKISDSFMVSADDQELASGAALLKQHGSPQAQALFASLIESHAINRMSPTDYDNARRRSLLMKTLFAADYAAAARTENAPPKVLLKFGAFHLYRGLNPVHGSGIGDYVAELAEGEGAQSLHIRLMPAKGTFPIRARGGRPAQTRAFNLRDDPGSVYLEPMLANLVGSDWTVFDLRPLRPGFDRLGESSPALANLVFGIDLLVLIPEATPSTEIR
jgi:hypothetical protein